jgi:hypothetical protein
MAKHRIIGGKEVESHSKYCPVGHGPPPAVWKQSERQCESPQLKFIPYRGSMTPGSSATNAKVSGKKDPKGDFKA